MNIDDSENAHYNYVGVVEDEEQKGGPAEEYYAAIEAADDVIEAAEEFLENLQADHTMPPGLHPSVEELRHMARANIEAMRFKSPKENEVTFTMTMLIKLLITVIYQKKTPCSVQIVIMQKSCPKARRNIYIESIDERRSSNLIFVNSLQG